MKKFSLFILSLFLFLYSSTKTSAVSDFTTSFNSVYTIGEGGETNVTHTISLKNNLAHIYATSYTIATSGENLKNITTSDESGLITSTNTVQNGITNIQLIINHPAIGKDQIKTLTISYQTDDVVEQIGDTTTINIPRLARANEAESYTRVVKVKGVGGLPQLIYPPQTTSVPEGDYSVYTFEGHQTDSLTLLFGKNVTYKLDLTYELKNKELSSRDSELALPPDTPYQHIILKSLTPEPHEIKLDQDGNWLARYSLKAQEKIQVKAEVYATVYPQPSLFDPSSTALLKTHGSKYWDTSSSTVTRIAEQLKTPENIYGYITSNFTYNYAGSTSGSPRKGAENALISPTNVLCTEYTDSFVSLARTLGYPSREINGYGYTKNSTLQPQNLSTDILHSWPEYYDQTKKTWISVDPTWGNTTGGIDYFNKLDFSHITFVRHGQEDSYPLPAGSYKSNPSDKFVLVEVAQTIPAEDLKYQVKKEGKRIQVINQGNVALINQKIDVDKESITVPYLPPYATYDVQPSHAFTLYDKIKRICATLFSKFLQLLPAST
jgi:hypothetical protein